MFAPDYAPHTGGVEKHLQQVIPELERFGHTVNVFVRYADYLPDFQEVAGVNVWRLPADDRWAVLLPWFWKHCRTLWAADLAHSHDVYPRRLRKLMRGIPWVHTFHGYETYPLSPEAVSVRQAIRREVSRCIGIGRFIEKWYGTQLDYVSYGARTQAARSSSVKAPAYSCVFVGRLEEDTGFRAYLEGFRLIHQQVPSASLTVYGDGSLSTWAHDLSRQHSLPVAWKGWKADADRHFAEYEVAFVSGYLTLLEAAAEGTPIVAYYGNPLKHDYLACHPLNQDIVLADSARSIAAAWQQARVLPVQDRDNMVSWAHSQTWRKLAETYLDAYAQAKRDSRL